MLDHVSEPLILALLNHLPLGSLLDGKLLVVIVETSHVLLKSFLS